MRRVYASLPLTGPSARLGRDLLRGAQLALEVRNGDIELVVLDSSGEDRDARGGVNARRAVADDGALAYLGDFLSSQVLASAPILEEAGLLAVAPVATFVGLSGATLVRLSPSDEVGARAIADWLVRCHVGEVLIVNDHDEGYGLPVAAMCLRAAGDRGLAARSRPVWDHDEEPASDIGDAGAVLYVGVAGSGAIAMWHELHAKNPDLWLLGTDGLALPRFAHDLEPAAAARTRIFVAQHASFGLYGYEAMALILDSIEAGGGDRAAIVGAARATQDRDGVIGRYSIDETGHTTSTAYGRVAIVDGALVWDS